MATNFDLDQAYLHDVVSAPLTEAMAQLAILQPKDPVDFLGHFLLKHAANAEAQQRLKNLEKQSTLITPLDLTEDHMDGGNRQHQELEWKRMCDEEKELQVQLLNEPSVARMVQKFVEWLCLTLHAEEAYIGRKCVNAEGTTIVHFIASSKHRKSSLVDRFVTQPADEEKEENNRRGNGVTFDAFKESAPTDENGDAAIDGEGNALPAIPPTFVHVENVLREPRVKFFGIPKLGALVMRARHYKSYLHADVYNESNTEEPNVLEQWLVFSADTVGQARAFTKKEMDRFCHATELFLTTLEEKERSLCIKDMERQSSRDEPLLQEFFVAFSAQVADQEEKLAKLLPEPAEGEEPNEASLRQRVTKESEFRLSFLTTLLVSHIPTISIVSNRVVPFKELVLLTFAAALELLSYTHIELYSPATGQPRWDKISLLLGEGLLTPSLKAFEASLMTMKSLAEADSTSANGLRAIRDALPATPAAVSLAKQILSDISKTDIDAVSPVASCFYVWTLAVIAYAESLSAMLEYAQDQAAAAGND